MSSTYLNWFTSDLQFPFYIQYGGHEEDTELHQHVDFSELVIVLNGNATHVVHTEEYFIKKGNAFVINGSTPHAYRDPHDFKICNIMFRPEMLASIGPDLKKSNGFQALFVLEPYYRNIQSYPGKLALPIPSLEYVESLIAVMIEEYHGQLQGYQTMLLSRFTELVVYLSRHYDTQEKGMEGNHLMHLANAISYMEDHYLEPLTLEEIAGKSSISVRHLNRIFRSYYQMTPIAYMLTLRLERACSLLKHSGLTITQISYECGFNDSNYFTRQFRKAYGVSPKGYRQNHTD
ncbi:MULTISPECIES: helix-turn-helix domain-containing protein [Paenibacillus]|uniref:AraC family transcriptional regulator n=1 Tax=Paenibacillus illinoisensis TaxID=59845 RepID=A0A2W0C742_9BACL|nr:helix-turn-helix domain-containing protein [Paenibacillus illinoisensis]MBM6382881.1 helix-turn-helix domain-containing protein [Paenibacillus sp.]PYY27807.1 AraC family transcriptional regulator [Paenibacillus illinoisensis]